jgi:hypothetical protein
VRYLIAALLMFAGLLLVLTLSGHGPDSADEGDLPFFRSPELYEAQETARELNEVVRRRQVFQARLDDTLRSVLDRRLGLEEAAGLIRAEAEKNNPRLIAGLERLTPELSTPQRFALLVINNLRLRRELSQLSPEQAEVVDELLCELSGWPDLAPAVRARLGLDP